MAASQIEGFAIFLFFYITLYLKILSFGVFVGQNKQIEEVPLGFKK